MAQSRKIKRKSGLSQREQERLDEKKKSEKESLATRISRIAVMVVFFVMVVSLLYTVILLS
ncbi:MAG: hypothetical protein IKJ30_03355 [Bacilli bacterium]|nr:hypothetical protein [Bacilli bacterium]